MKTSKTNKHKSDKEVKPAVYLLVDRKHKVVAYTSVNVPDVTIVREDADAELFKQMKKYGAAVLACPYTNHVIGLGLEK